MKKWDGGLMTIKELHDTVKSFFLGKIDRLSVSLKYRRVSCMLYESFRLECCLSNSGKKFRARLWVAPCTRIEDFLGKDISEIAESVEVLRSLKTIDDYCRLRLPEKFLKLYDKQSRTIAKLSGDERWRARQHISADAEIQKDVGDAMVRIDIEQLDTIVKDFFGVKAGQFKLDKQQSFVEFVIYDTYLIHCGLDPLTGSFGARTVMGGEFASNTFMGKLLPLRSDVESVRRSLKIIDEQCRLRLPDKFLVAFELYKRMGQ